MTEITRSTKELITPNEHKVVVYDYVTGGELRQFQAFFLEDMHADDLAGGDASKSQALSKIKASTMLKAQELLVELLVVSVDGEEGDGWKMVADLRPEDTDFVIAALDKYTTDAEGKKKSN